MEGIENLDRTRGAVLIGAHQANWEYMAACVRKNDIDMAIIVRSIKPAWLDTHINNARTATGITTIPKEDAATKALQYLKQGKTIGILADQAPRDNAIPTTFFGQPCHATAGPVLIALRAKVPIYPIQMIRTAPGKYRVIMHPPIEITRTKDLRQDLTTNTQRCQDILEATIRQHPGQWLWFHRRWKTRPQFDK